MILFIIIKIKLIYTFISMKECAQYFVVIPLILFPLCDNLLSRTRNVPVLVIIGANVSEYGTF